MNNEKEEFSSDKTGLVNAVKNVKWWEYIPIIGGYLFFCRITFARVNYVKEIRTALVKYTKWIQRMTGLMNLPFAITLIALWIIDGWGFRWPAIVLISIFAAQFISFYIWKSLFLKGLKTLG